MPASELEQEKARHKQELGVQRQISFASGIFQGDITIRTILESLAEGVVIVEIRGTILLVNTLAEQMFGYPGKEFIGKPLAVLFPERFRKIHEEHMAHFFTKPMINPTDHLLDLAGLRQDGSEFPVEISLSYIETINGVLALVFFNDITRRKQAERHLRESEELFRIQVECVQDYAIFMLDPQGNVLNWNTGAERMKGYRAEEITGKHFSCFYSQEERNAGKPEEELKIAVKEGRVKDEGWRVRKDGSRFWADVLITAIYDESGNLRGFSKVTHDITDHKRLETEIQDALEYAENIVETVREPLVVMNSDLKILTANHSFYDTFQVTPEATIGKFIYDLGNRQWDIPKLRVLLEEILPNDTVFNGYEVEHDFQDIGRKIILLNARQIFRETIGSHIILLAMEDITERKRLETEIQDALEYAENIVETVREPLVVLNSDLKILTANHSFYDTFQVTPEATIGKFIYDLGNRQWDIPKLRVLLEEILPNDTVFNGYEVEHDFQDIGRKIILLNARQIFRETIGSHIILLAMEDITERKRLETEIQDALEYAENIVETVREPLVVLNSDLKILTANHSFYDTFQVTPEATIGKFIYDLGNRQWDIPKLRVLLEEILPNDTVFNGYEVEHDFQDIGRKIILLNARQIFRETIGSHIILLAMEDITERKQAEEEIERVNTELEAANLELEAFNYTVAHDLRNPLNVISSYCQVFKELCGDKLDEQCLHYIHETYNGTLRMNRLIEALLNFSRLAHAEPNREKVDLSSMARDVAADLKVTVAARRVEIRIADGIVADGDANLLRVVLTNLLGNAWKYTATREEALIEFGTQEIDGKSVYFVRDNGPGFDNAAADKIFAPFQCLPGAEECRGFGIGLATVERIIRRHGGRVWAEGVPGKGATFYFTLSADGVSI